ncbi:MAG TPA: hypothetical protein PKZ84_16130 [Anaerolineae bacterium]|nr:hypothetical protein [Anaerolineae bacterium]HQI86126.1 hypothetical protein [Anaerolineae bacterium]
MGFSYLEYELRDGYIHNWLVAGPQAIAVPDLDRYTGGEPERKLQIAQHFYTLENLIHQTPVDRESFTIDDVTLTWRYTRCLDDHFVDKSTFHHTWHYLRTWAYTQLYVWEDQEATFIITTNGPADVWVNGEHVHRHEHFHHQQPVSVRFTATLRATDDKGQGNEILVRFEEVAARECPYVMALRVADIDLEDVEVKVPSATERTVRHVMLERVFEQACIEEVANYRGKVVNLHWADDLETNFNYEYNIQGPGELARIHVSGEIEAKPGEVVDIGHGYRIWQGPYRAVLRAVSQESAFWNVRYQWDMPFYILDTAYSETPYGTMEERSHEALTYAATQKNDLYAEIAKFELGKWKDVDQSLILKTIESINERGDCSDFYLVGLLGAMYRYMDQDEFPHDLKAPLKDCVLNFKYWHDEPGADAMCYTTENHSILFHTCEILAGQLYPDEVFSNAGQTGQWHREKGEQLALAWLKTRGATGFWEWDSNCYFEEDLLALSHLASLAETEQVVELAAVIMDKMLLTMALNSYKGVFGSTHGRTYAPHIKSGQLEATSGICRLMWGQGVYNQHLRGLVAMACSGYDFPLMIADIATDQRDEMWNRERHVINAAGDEINKVTYRTPDYMLASAQDYRPGEKGYQQHIWQATFGPDAVVFVNHPPVISEDGAHRPNFWAGNYILPRVAQWKDTLFALYNVPEDDWLGFTHAHFPVYMFDAYEVHDNWAFARKGDGYLALYASNGLTLMKRGPAAYRELRSYGCETVWICQMGRAAVDGSFEQFQQKVLSAAVDVQGLAVTYATLRGETLSFGWEGALLRDGVEQAITGFKHYENPYCVADLPATEMDINVGGYVMRLTF